MKKKILIIAILIFVMAGCDKLSEITVDNTSSPTKKFNESGVTEADKQFGNSSTDKKITEIRPKFSDFLEKEFENKNLKDIKLGTIEYKINNKAISMSFDNEAQHIIKNNSYDYTIDVKKLDKKYSNSDFIKVLKKKDANLKELEVGKIGVVLVKNNKNNYSSEIHVLFNKGEESYYYKIKSDLLSIPEVVVLAKKFSKNLR